MKNIKTLSDDFLCDCAEEIAVSQAKKQIPTLEESRLLCLVNLKASEIQLKFIDELLK